MTTSDDTARGDTLRRLDFTSIVDRCESARAEAESAHATIASHLRDLIDAYRTACSGTAPNGMLFAASHGHALAPCPICGQRTAVLSSGDIGTGPTVQIFCDNGDCPAREIDITIRRGFLHEPFHWDAPETYPGTYHATPEEHPQPAKRPNPRPNQNLWKRMWRVRHGGVLICNHCAASENETTIHIDHIVELRDGGEDADWNTQPLCVDCHQRKTMRRNRR